MLLLVHDHSDGLEEAGGGGGVVDGVGADEVVSAFEDGVEGDGMEFEKVGGCHLCAQAVYLEEADLAIGNFYPGVTQWGRL